MNKIQIKAEVLATLNALSNAVMPSSELLNSLKKIDDKKTVLDILVKELVNASEQKTILICWLLVELIEKETLNNELWEIIKSPEYPDSIKMIAFNMLRDLGNQIDYEVISGYFEQFNELINQETKNLLDTAIMNPEAQIDFMDFLNALNDNDKISLIKSLEDDYAHDALANILIPVFLYYKSSEVGLTALEILGRTKSQLAFHAIQKILPYLTEKTQTRAKKALSELKMAGVRIDKTDEFYKEILKESAPYKVYISFPDGHGNMAIIFTRIRANKTLQFLAVVINPKYGILDSFGFNSIAEHDFHNIVEKFYNYEEKYEINAGVAKYLIEQALENSYLSDEPIPYEYICWESILLDIEPEKPQLYIDKKELNQKEIDKLCLNNYVQNWFYDEITSEEFKSFIDDLSKEFKTTKFNLDIDKFVADNFDKIYTGKELTYKLIQFNIAAYLRMLKGDQELATVFYSLGSNYSFLTNILRKSIYEYYVGKRYILKNKRNSANVFEKRMQQNKEEDFELLQLDMIISSIESRWVDHA